MIQPSQALQLFLDFFDSNLFLALQIIGGILSIVFLAGTIVLIHKGGLLGRHIKDLWVSWNASPAPKHRMVKQWIAIKKSIASNDPALWKQAILSADAMLDEVIVKLGYRGGTLEERLGNITQYQFPSLENAWRAHEITKFIKGDPSYPLSREITERTIEIYEDIFRETGILL